jgi:hypothetical protein
MIFGYVLWGQDNDSFMFEDEKHPNAATCSSCGYLLNFNYHNANFKIKRKVFHLSHCYDTGDIISLTLKEYLIRKKYAGVQFASFDNEKTFYQIFLENEIELDPVKREVQFSNKCSTCNNYEEVIGATPCFLKNENPIEDGFFKSDLYFGSGNRKCPIILIGVETKEKLMKEKLKGFSFEPIHDYDSWLREIQPKLPPATI